MSHSYLRRVEGSIEQQKQPPAGSQPLKFNTLYSQDTTTQFLKCLWKQNLVYWRSPPYNAMRLLFTIISAFIFGSLFWDIGSKRYASFMILICQKKSILSMKNKGKSSNIPCHWIFCRETTQQIFVVMGCLFSACLFVGVNNASSVQPVVSIERTVFYREKAAGMYSPMAYAAAQVGLNVLIIIFKLKFPMQITYHDYLNLINRGWWRSHTFLFRH